MMKYSVALLGCYVGMALSALAGEMREWTDEKGRKIEAMYIGQERGMVTLKMKNGRVGKVKVSTLSKEDQQWLAKLAKEEVKEQKKPIAQPEGKKNPSRKLNDLEKVMVGLKEVGMTIPDVNQFTPNPHHLYAQILLPAGHINFFGKHPYEGMGNVVRHSEGVTIVNLKGVVGMNVYNKEGKVILGKGVGIDFPEVVVTHSMVGYSDGMFWTEVKGQDAFIDLKGKVTLVGDLLVKKPFQDGVALVRQRSTPGYAFMDKSGKIVSSHYYSAKDFSNGRAWVKEKSNDKYQLVDTQFKVVAKGFRKVDAFKGEYTTADAAVIDRNGNVHIPKVSGRFINDGDSESGVAIVEFIGYRPSFRYKRFLHMASKQVFGPKLKEAEPFRGGVSVVEVDGKKVLMNLKCEELKLPFEIGMALYRGFGIYEIYKKDDYKVRALINTHGQLIYEFPKQ